MAAVAGDVRAPANVQTLILEPGTQWQCVSSVVCDDDIMYPPTEPGNTPFLIDGHRYCLGCIQVQFQLAMDNELSWPPNIQNRTLNVNDFAGAIDPAFLASYTAQEAIYNTGAIEMRVHCPHIRGTAGPCQQLLGARVTGAAQWQQCATCGGTVCMVCSGPQPPNATDHICESADADYLDSLRNGTDLGYAYQLCLRCNRNSMKDVGECNHMWCLCGIQFCFQCGEAHEDNVGGDNRHWSRRTVGCPRYRSLDVRRPFDIRGRLRDAAYQNHFPQWDYDDFEVRDVARWLLERRLVDNWDTSNRYTGAIPVIYPPSRQQDRPLLRFAALLAHTSPVRSLARRVIDTHDRLLIGDFAALWLPDRPSEPGVDLFAEGKTFVDLLTTLRHIVNDMHNRANRTNLGSSDAEILQRVTFTHQVNILRLGVRHYDSLDLRDGGLESLRLRNNQGWIDMLYRFHQLHFAPGDISASGDMLNQPAILQRALADATGVLANLATTHTIAVPEFTPASQRLQAIVDILQRRGFRDGNLSIPESSVVQNSMMYLQDCVVDVVNRMDLEPTDRVSMDVNILVEIATTLPFIITEWNDGDGLGTEADYWTDRYNWVHDLLFTIVQERLSRAAADQSDPPRMEELQHVLSIIEPFFAHLVVVPVRYTRVPNDVWRAVLQLRDDTRYDAGDGILEPVFAQAYTYLRSALSEYGRARPDDRDLKPARTFPRNRVNAMWARLNDVSASRGAIRIQRDNNPGDQYDHLSWLYGMLRLVEDMMLRLVNPLQDQVQEVEEPLNRLREAYISIEHRWGVYQNLSRSRAGSTLIQYIPGVLRAADRDPRINTQAQTARALLSSRLQAAEGSLQGSTDIEYINGILFTLNRDRDLWDRPGPSLPGADAISQQNGTLLAGLCADLEEVLTIRNLPSNMRDDDSRITERDSLWRVFRGANYLNIAQGQGIMALIPRMEQMQIGLVTADRWLGESIIEWWTRMAADTGIPRHQRPW